MSQFRPMPPADTAYDPAMVDPPTETSSEPAIDGTSPAGRNIAILIAAEGAEDSETLRPVVDDQGPNTRVTSRKPQDLPEFCGALVRCIEGP